MKARKQILPFAAAMGSLALAATSANAAVIGQLGILEDTANGGINPDTGAAWANGDTYRMFFVSSATLGTGNDAGGDDISYYDALVQGAANTAGLGGASWFTVAESVNDGNVGDSAYAAGSTDVGIFMVNNALLANDIAGLVHPLAIAPNVTETGGTYNGQVATGQNSSGYYTGLVNANFRLGPSAPSTQTGAGWSNLPDNWFVGGAYNGTPKGNMGQNEQAHFYAISEDLTVVISTGPDNDPPVISTLSPADDAPDVAPSADLVATFDEDIALKTGGTVTIRNLGPSPDPDEVITIPDAARLSVLDNVLTINPTTDLDTGNNYAVQISNDAIEDLAASPNAFAGISDDTTWNFTTVTPDTTAPTLASVAPVDDSTGVAITVSPEATFSKDIALTGSGSITLRNLSGGSDVPITLATDVSIIDEVLTITPPSALAPEEVYAVEISSDAIEDLSGNDYAGLTTGEPNWSFTTSANAGVIGQLGILEDTANGGINPKTGAAWANGDTYRLFFVSAATLGTGNDAGGDNISYYDGLVQTAANAAGLGGASWFCVGESVNDGNVGASAYAAGSTDVGIFMVNNALLANDIAGLVHPLAIAPNVTETGGTYNGQVATGQNSSGYYTGLVNTNFRLGPSAPSTQTGAGWSNLPDNWFVGGAYNGTPKGNMGQNEQAHFYAISEDLTVVSTVASIASFEAAGATGVINHSTKTIDVEVPFGTDLATLAPTYTLSSGTCDQPNDGTTPPTPTFADQNPVDYVVTDTSTDPDTVNTYSVTVTVAPEPPVLATLVIDLGTSPAGTTIEGGTFGTYVADPGFPTNLPLPSLPAGSILQSIAVAIDLVESTLNENFTNDLAVLVDPTPGTPGGDFSLGIISPDATVVFGLGETLTWVGGGDGNLLTETKTDADWTGDIDLATNGLFLGNGFQRDGWTSPEGGTWSGTITLTYVVGSGGGNDYADWIALFPGAAGDTSFGGDPDSDGVGSGLENFFGTDPGVFSAGLVSGVVDTGAGTFTFTHPLNATPADDVSATYRWSTDLDNFYADGGPNGAGTTTVSFAQGTPSGGMVTVTATITGTVIPDKLFVDVEATQN